MKRGDFPLSTARQGGSRIGGSRSGAAQGASDGTATIRELLSFKLHVVANLLSRGAALRYKREFGVSLMEWRTLALLGGGAPLSLNELAKLAGLDKSQMSRVVGGLTERGLILRAVDSEDARGVRLSLTAGGRKVYAGLIAAANERNDAFLAALDAKEQQLLEGVFEKLAIAARGFIHAEGAAGKPARGKGTSAGTGKAQAKAGANGTIKGAAAKRGAAKDGAAKAGAANAGVVKRGTARAGNANTKVKRSGR